MEKKILSGGWSCCGYFEEELYCDWLGLADGQCGSFFAQGQNNKNLLKNNKNILTLGKNGVILPCRKTENKNRREYGLRR